MKESPYKWQTPFIDSWEFQILMSLILSYVLSLDNVVPYFRQLAEE